MDKKIIKIERKKKVEEDTKLLKKKHIYTCSYNFFLEVKPYLNIEHVLFHALKTILTHVLIELYKS